MNASRAPHPIAAAAATPHAVACAMRVPQSRGLRGGGREAHFLEKETTYV